MPDVVASIGLSIVVLLNFVATVMLVRSDFDTQIQKALQLVFVWAVPIVGSIFVIAVLKFVGSDRKHRFGSGSPDDPGFSGIGIGIGTGSEGCSHQHGGHGGGSGDAGHGGDSGHSGH
jgi:hypothetical protein